MFKAIFYKEWIKTRRIILLLGLIFTGFIVYTFINTAQMFRLNEAVEIWSGAIYKDMMIIPDSLKWLLLLAAMMVGFSQFVPEMTDKRLKLTLHLPLSETKTVSYLLIFGLCVLALIYIVTLLVLFIGLGQYYTTEIMIAMLWKTLPWLMAGLIGYLFTAWVCLEPVWRQRIFNSFIAAGGLMMFYIGAKSGAYTLFLPYLLVLVIVGFGFPFYSASRFKDGEQR